MKQKKQTQSSQDEKNKNLLIKITNFKIVIIIFVLIAILVPFYESGKVIRWATQNEKQRSESFELFNLMALSYAYKAEDLKAELGMDEFFNKEKDLFLELKKSPLIFQENLNENQFQSQDSENKMEIIPNKKLEGTFKALVIGDSFMAVNGGLGTPLEKLLVSYDNLTVTREGKVSSGLARRDYFNWDARAKELINEYKPNIVIAFFGSNDSQGLTTSSGKVATYYGSKKWNEDYRLRVEEILSFCQEKNILVFWVGLPIMKDPKFSQRIINFNSIFEEATENYTNAYFVPIYELLTDNNHNYTDYLLNEKGAYQKIRSSDGVHLQFFGGELISKEIIKKIGELIELK